MDSPALQITPIPAFSDNYIWLLQNADCNRVALVDQGDPAPVLKHLRAHRLELSALLITHHHWDHVGAIAELRAVFPKCRVYGPRDRHIPDVTDWVAEGCDVVLSALGEGVSFNVLAVPGHTATHVAYYRAGMLFCGDTLFAGGCGRVFDGTFAQLAASLQRIAHLPADTLVYCAHEYTLANLGFARWVEPDNSALRRRQSEDRERLASGKPSVPSLLATELQTNPFLRTGEPSVIAAAERFAGHALNDAADVFRVLRQWKDREYD